MEKCIKYLKFTDSILHNLIVIAILSIVVVLVTYIIAWCLDQSKEKDKRIDFAHKHPCLNIISSFAIVIGLGALAVWAISYLGVGLLKFFKETSKLDTVVFVAILTGLISIISNIIGKYIDYRKSRQEYLAQKREASYGQFVDMVYKIHRNSKKPNSYTNDDMLEDLSKFSKEITLWGSADVVKKWDEFRYNGGDQNKAEDNIFILEDIMNAMRKDLGVSKMKQGDLLAFFVNDIKEVIKKRKSK